MRYSQFKCGIAFVISLLLCVQPVMADTLAAGGVKIADVEDVTSGDAEMGDDRASIDETSVKNTGDNGEPVEFESEVIYPLTTAPAFNTLGIDDGKIELTQGNHEKWIERIQLPDYAREVYDTFSDPDFWTNENNYTASPGCANNIAHVTWGTDFIGLRINSSENSNIVKVYARVAFDAFDRDHPEVFWLSSKTVTMSFISGGADNELYYTYLMIKDNKPDEQGKYFDMRTDAYKETGSIQAAIEQRNAWVDAIKEDIPKTATDYEKVKHFNNWLTKHNQYNTDVSSGVSEGPASCRECISALEGNGGAQGPVCEGYARAFKVLCDSENIPCVLVDGVGQQTANGSSEAHMWNYVQLDGKWYGVDVTWNDPTVSGSGKESGDETTEYLCVGSTTESRGQTFIQSHQVQNVPSDGGTAFPNGPVLSEESYDPETAKPLAEIKDHGKYEKSYTYNGHPIADPEEGNFTTTGGAITYEWYESNKKLESAPTDAGTYTLRVKVAASDEYAENYLDVPITITKAGPTVQELEYEAPSALVYDGQIKSADVQKKSEINGLGTITVKYKRSGEESFLEGEPVNAGTYDVYAQIEEGANYSADSVKVGSFTIQKADHPTSLPNSEMTVSYTVKTVGEVELPDDWAWENDGVKLTVGEPVKAKAVYQGSDAGKGNYENEAIEITITRSPCAHTGGEGTATCVEGKICDICGERYGDPDLDNHSYGEPEWIWNDDEDVTVTFKCTRNAGHIIKDLPVNVKKKQSGNTIVYTATTTLNGKSYTTVKQVTENPVEMEGIDSTRLVIQDDVAKVPDQLKDSETLSSIKAIEEAMQEELKQTMKEASSSGDGYKEENTKAVEVELQKKSGDSTWESVDPDNFPEQGLTITIPYPIEDWSTHDFFVSHMFTYTSDDGRHKAGDVEILPSTKTPDGLRVTVYSLSPFMVAWKETASAPIPSGPSGYDPAPSAPSVTVETDSAINGSFSVSDKNARAGDTVKVTPTPNTGYVVDQITVTDKDGKPVEVKDSGDGTYSFVMPEAQPVKVSVTFKDERVSVQDAGALVFADPADKAKLTDIATTVGTGSNARFKLNLVAGDGTELETSTKWKVTSDDTKIVHVTAKKKLRFSSLGETMVTVTAKAKDSDAVYSIKFPVNVTKLGTPTFTLKRGKTANAFRITPDKVYGATKLTLRYSRKKGLATDETGSKWKHIKNSETAETIRVKKGNRRYYVKVRACVKVNGKNMKYDWSAVHSIKSR